MRRKSLLLTVVILAAAAAGVAGILGALLKHEPEFYVAGEPAGAGEVTLTQSAMLVTRVQDLKNDIRSKSEWGATFRAEDLNSFFQENLSADGGLTGVLIGPDSTAASAKIANECTAKLRALVPPDAAAHGIGTLVKVVESRDVAEAICQAAERLGVDAICVGTHGRSGLSKAVLGSVAKAVLTHTRRPLFVVPSHL